jgi:hypothetical protein
VTRSYGNGGGWGGSILDADFRPGEGSFYAPITTHCGTVMAIAPPRKAPTSFEAPAVSTPAPPQPRAKTPNRIILFTAVGGGVLAFLLLAVALVLILKSGGSKSSVEAKGQLQQPHKVEPRTQRAVQETPASTDVPAQQKPPSYWINRLKQDEPVHSESIEALAKMGTSAVPDLLKAFKSQGSAVCRGVIEVLGRMGPAAKDSVDALIPELVGPNCKEAAEALGLVGPASRRAVSYLFIVLEKRGESALLARVLGQIDPEASTLYGNFQELRRNIQVGEAKYDLAKTRYESEKDAGITPERTRELLMQIAKRSQSISDMKRQVADIVVALSNGTYSKISDNQLALQNTAVPAKESSAGEQRAKLLAELEAKERDALAALQEENRQLEAALEQLRKEEAALRKNPRFGDPFNKQAMSQFNNLLKQQRALASKIQKTRESLDQKISDFEQERRKISVQFSAPADPKFVEHKGLLYSQEELDCLKAYEKEHASPRKVAASYMKSLIAKGLVSRPAFAGFFKNPKGNDSYAVAYKVSSVNGRKVLGDTVHLYVFKDKQGDWRVSAFSQDGVHVMLGPPPREFQPVPDPGK